MKARTRRRTASSRGSNQSPPAKGEGDVAAADVASVMAWVPSRSCRSEPTPPQLFPTNLAPRPGQAAGGERQDPAGGRPGGRGPRQPAQGLAQRAPRGRHGRGPGAAEGRGGRAGPAAAGGEAARAGERDPQEGRGFFRQGGGRLMRYRFVAAERATFPVRTLCRIVGVAVSGFYAWLRRGPGRRRRDDRQVGERIGAIFAASRRTYGSPRVHAELRAEGVRVGRKRVAGL